MLAFEDGDGGVRLKCQLGSLSKDDGNGKENARKQ